eukprot:TRINITY_DN1757_c0_g2_i1.p1 TRINITY_DN1757_c0_g2~~TRINITY_DN1757_c0_g2_i1.p1  ORF type:complete len:230 (-),score=47.21 TRINITY_DN1757_c0_g2_i1:66-686(-)
MANQGPSYGIVASIKQKRAETYDVALEGALQRWIEAVLQTKFPSNFQASLKDGVILCQLANVLRPNSVRKFDTGSNLKPFKMMENINAFLKACVALGLHQNDCFVTVDLYEGKNMNTVLDTLQLLAKHATKSITGYKGPNLDDYYKSPAQNVYQEEIEKAQNYASGVSNSQSYSKPQSSSYSSTSVASGAPNNDDNETIEVSVEFD